MVLSTSQVCQPVGFLNDLSRNNFWDLLWPLKLDAADGCYLSIQRIADHMQDPAAVPLSIPGLGFQSIDRT